MNGVVHFEIPAENIEQAKKFYGSVFGWNLQDWPMPDGSTYVGVHTTPIDEKTRMPKEVGAINGGIVKRSAQASMPILAVNVTSVDDYLKKVENAGGTIVMPKTDVMGMGWYAYFSDGQGNTLGLWEDAKKK